MIKKYFRNVLMALGLMIISISAYAQQKSSIWTEISSNQIDAKTVQFYKQIPQKSKLFNVDVNELSNILVNSPKSESYDKTSNVVVQLPNAEGAFESFRISEISIMEPSLAAQFPEIKTYVGVGVENPAAMLRLTITPQKGLSGMILSEKKTIFIEPYSSDLKTYITFVNSEGDINTDSFICETESVLEKSGISDKEYRAMRNADDGQLRTYRLALACTGEYAQYHGGTLGSVMAAMATSMNRVNGVYVRDLGLTMTMVDNTSIIFFNAGTDPYTNNNGGAMLGQNQTTCDANIGSANYDIGHVFSTGGGGVAYLNSPCTGFKAGGVTGSGAPVGDAFDIDYVAHEMGHQFGGNHTQNNSCNRSAVSVEPGSASTIMGYAGICAPNVQNNSDDYFHGENIKEMWINISVGASSACGTSTSSGNTAPTADAGSDYSIPPSTAFKLTGVGTDVDSGNGLTYSWEQNDTTPAPMPPQATNTAGPTFRSIDPKTVPVRYFPEFSTVLSGSLASTWEVVPSVARTMGFLFTVRDNAPIAGNSQSDEMVVTVENVTPFTVSTPPTWGQNTTQAVNWVLGQSANATINCQSVNILFAANGVDFDTTLASGVANTGTASITVPNIANTNNAKILVEAADNIFYAVSNAFPINGNSDFSISNTSGDQSACNIDSVMYEFNYVTSNGFSETATFSATGAPAGANVTFTPTELSDDGTFTMTVDNLLTAAVGDYFITVTGTTASFPRSTTVNLTITDGLCASVANTTYETSTTLVQFNTIDNASGKPSGYSDYTNISTDVNQESSYDLTVNMNTDGNFLCVSTVWVDWNQNCVFDANEMYDLGSAVNVTNGPSGNSPLSVTVPADAMLGNTTMRVTTKYNSAASACENSHDAEVEDYTINVLTSLSVDEFEMSSLSIFPNPNNGEFTVKLNSTNSNQVNIQVFDIRGRSIFDNTYNHTGEFRQTINLSNAQSGMYLLNINDGSKTVIKKIIVE